MAAEYDNVQPGSVVVKDNGHHDRDRSFEAALIASGDDSAREATVAAGDAARDLSGFIGTSGQHVDLMSAIREEGGDNRQATERARGDLASSIIAGDKDSIIATLQASKENVTATLDQGSRGREVTLESKSDLMEQHCETQKLVLEEGSRTREAVHAEAERTRELVRDEFRDQLARELSDAKASNGLLQLQINLLSSGNGPLKV